MYKSRIMISVILKIMINSQDVYFDIARQCAQVELKNINVFSKKNHLSISVEMGNNLFNKINFITLCNF
jgi:hypothetical protein